MKIRAPSTIAGMSWMARGKRHWAWFESPTNVPYEIHPAMKDPMPSMNCWRDVIMPLMEGWAISDW